MGNGFYAASGRQVQLYNLPFSWTLRKMQEDRLGLRLRAPISFGFYDFKTTNVLLTGAIPNVQTLTFLPGLEFQIPIYSNWALYPFGDYGVAKDFSGGKAVQVFGTGLKSVAKFPLKQYLLTLGNRVIWAGQSASSVILSGDIGNLETGLDLRLPWRFHHMKRTTFTSIYYNNFFYFRDLEFLRLGEPPVRVDVQHEFGVTYGSDEKLGFISNPRIGLGYRFGDRVDVFRLVLGMPF